MELLPWFRALHIAGTVMIGGACAFEFLILRGCGATPRSPRLAPMLGRWMRRQLAWGVGIGMLSWIGWLLAVAISMSGLPAMQALAPGVLGTVLSRTSFGTAWWIRLALLLAVVALLARGRARWQPVGAPLLATSIALVATLAWTGHALGAGLLHAWVDAAHLLAATAWLGMLPLLWLVTRQALADPYWDGLAAASAHRFFLPGSIAVAVLVASGLANTSWMLESLEDLTDTRYGHLLLLKLVLFAAMLVLAVLNRSVIVPRVQRLADPAQALRLLRTSVLVEVMLGLAILAVVAWLGVTPPVAHEGMTGMPP